MTRLTYNTTYPGPRTSYMIAFRACKKLSVNISLYQTYSGTHITVQVVNLKNTESVLFENERAVELPTVKPGMALAGPGRRRTPESRPGHESGWRQGKRSEVLSLSNLIPLLCRAVKTNLQ